MSSIDKLNLRTRRKNLRWAVITYYRGWLEIDGIESARARANGNALDSGAVRRIGKVYSIVRGIRGADTEEKRNGTDKHAEWIADRLNAKALDGRSSLIQRAEICAAIARDACSEGHTNGVQASAMTKLVWFIKPEGWTVFDNLAANGLGIPRYQSIDRMLAFYRTLTERGFPEHARAINATIGKTSFSVVGGERIIDTYLMLCGGEDEWVENVIANSKAFHKLLPSDFRNELVSCARRISKDHATGLLVR